MKLLPVPSSHVTENSLSSINGLSNGLKEEHEALFFHENLCVKRQDFYIKRQLSYKNIFCKKTAFIQKYSFVEKQTFYIKKKLFYKIYFCKKAGFLHIKAVFLQQSNL